MSVTTLLIPIQEPVAEQLLAGESLVGSTVAPSLARARTLRRLVSTVDAVREELHAVLFEAWSGSRPPSFRRVRAVIALFRPPPPPSPSAGYDPFVHLFGRSLPIDAPSPHAVARELEALLLQPAEEALTRLSAMVGGIHPSAQRLLEEAALADEPVGLAPRLAELSAAAAVTRDGHADLSASLAALGALFALLEPLWRLDGQSLPELLSTLGWEESPGNAAPLLEELTLSRPELASAASVLPARLHQHVGVGAYLSSSDVKRVLGALRLRRTTLIQNAAASQSPQITLRHLRLLEEAMHYCESNDAGLMEAAGLDAPVALPAS